MVFWILLGLTVAIALFFFLAIASEGAWGAAIGMFFVVVAVGVIVLLVYSAFASMGSYNTGQTEKTYKLAAIDTGGTTEGHSYFLGRGYIQDHRTLDYIKREDGGFSTVSQEWAEDSRIFEDETDNPVVIEYRFTFGNPWLLPWETGWSTSADFHIPPGSIVEDYSVTNK